MADTLKTNVSSFDSTNSSYYNTSSSYPASNGVAGNTSTTEARFILTTGRNAESFIYYNFDCSSIPSNATINSVTCSVKCRRSSTSTGYIASANVQLTTGTTTKGSSTYITSTSAQTLSVSGGTSWTRSELNSVKIRAYGKRGTSGTTSTRYYIGFYGATLTVTYTAQGVTKTIRIKVNNTFKEVGKDDVRIKVGGTWKTPTKMYIKQNNSWKEVT